MAETKEEQFARLHAKFGKKKDEESTESSDNPSEDKAEGEGNGKAKTKSTAKRGRPKKTPAERRADELESGRRTAGRAGTGDFLGGGAKKAKRKKKVPPTPDPARLANKVMADAGPSVSAPPPATPFVGPMPPAPSPRASLLSRVLSTGQDSLWRNPMSYAADIPHPGGFGNPYSAELGAAIPGYPVGPNAQPIGRGPRPSVGVQSAEAIPAAPAMPMPPPTKVKTVSIPPAQEDKAPAKAPSSSKSKPKPKKAKSASEKMADDMEKQDKTGPNDYYEQLKRGGFNLSK